MRWRVHLWCGECTLCKGKVIWANGKIFCFCDCSYNPETHFFQSVVRLCHNCASCAKETAKFIGTVELYALLWPIYLSTYAEAWAQRTLSADPLCLFEIIQSPCIDATKPLYRCYKALVAVVHGLCSNGVCAGFTRVLNIRPFRGHTFVHNF